MAPRHTTSSHRIQASNDNAPFRTTGNVNAPPRNIEEVMAHPPLVEGMAQTMDNLERWLEL